MVTKVSSNVVRIKDIPSNLIEEAIFILKTNIKEDEKSKEIKKHSKDIILKEAEEIINEYMMSAQKEHEEKRQIEREEKRRLKKIKTNVIFLSCTFALICFLISMLIK